MNYGLSVHPGMGSLVFSKVWHGARNLYVRDSAGLFEENRFFFFCPQNGKNGPKIGFFKIIERFDL